MVTQTSLTVPCRDCDGAGAFAFGPDMAVRCSTCEGTGKVPSTITPGTWVFDPANRGGHYNTWGIYSVNEFGTITRPEVCSVPDSEHITANASLIAAAPQLLAACIAAIKDADNARQLLTAAIEAATGQRICPLCECWGQVRSEYNDDLIECPECDGTGLVTR